MARKYFSNIDFSPRGEAEKNRRINLLEETDEFEDHLMPTEEDIDEAREYLLNRFGISNIKLAKLGYIRQMRNMLYYCAKLYNHRASIENVERNIEHSILPKKVFALAKNYVQENISRIEFEEKLTIGIRAYVAVVREAGYDFNDQ